MTARVDRCRARPALEEPNPSPWSVRGGGTRPVPGRVGLGTRAGACAAALLLAACAPLTPRVETSRISGRLSLQVAAQPGQPQRGLNASFDLLGTAESGELRLSVPLGPQIAAARWSAGQASLDSPDGRQTFDSLAELARRALGEDLPIQALPDWLAGRPWPGAPHQAPTAARFEQLGWSIDLERRDEGFIIATRAQPPAVTLRVRLDPP